MNASQISEDARTDSAEGTKTTRKSNSKAVAWTGRGLGAAAVALLTLSGIMKVSGNPLVTEGFTKMGFNPDLAFGIGIVELICTALYAVPRTAALGAILLTGYLGGAVVTHLRINEPWVMPILVGVVLWSGLVMRQPHLRSIVPWCD